MTFGGYYKKKKDGALSKAAALQFLKKQDCDGIVLDVNLPDGNGFDICREMKERCPDTAVIFQRKDAALLKRIVTQSGGDYHSSFQSHSLYWGTADQQSIQEVLRQVEEDNKENTKDEWKAGRFENAKGT